MNYEVEDEKNSESRFFIASLLPSLFQLIIDRHQDFSQQHNSEICYIKNHAAAASSWWSKYISYVKWNSNSFSLSPHPAATSAVVCSEWARFKSKENTYDEDIASSHELICIFIWEIKTFNFYFFFLACSSRVYDEMRKNIESVIFFHHISVEYSQRARPSEK